MKSLFGTTRLPDRNLALEFCRGTEAAAMSAGRLMGRGDKNAADGAAVNAMRYMLNTVDMDGIVVIGEGEKDEAPMLFNGEHLGTGKNAEVDIAVDPIDGTRLTALGISGAISVVAGAPRGTMFNPKTVFYMNKLVVGPEAKDVIDIEAPVAENIRRVAEARKKATGDITVVVLDRPRHEKLIGEIRAAGARIKLITDGDIAGALLTCKLERGADMLMGIGGTPEAVITACAIKAMGGNMQGKLWARSDEERQKALDAGMDFNKVLTIDDLVRSDDVFFAATGITDGDFLKGVRYEGERIYTSSLVMRAKSGTVRYIDAVHSLYKLDKIAGIDYKA
ncbi:MULTISPECIES: class II fructose-bisphosphatase [unclassified Pyramidobacter]|uniref:class II fructose-bisphosphatase n=1 Tax=unclassified Pyramidobacter TaxID=2632171 RepID=UPI00098FE422|nr:MULTISPECIES: class II fructose-bisphosphatase [unclassified Pyramidobacter]MCI7404224.1 class II fructose-bisphosphatase [Pyramidobacter sp.]MDY3212923.1 class II fructose-bisphosphatase [Pyramidobacter sp.]OON88940.1 fructose-bisphosphatase, class II [Pyramidobacter sp. C12-8]RKJ80688.1 class II fructose-bisphosphatase [Pyramidobacter sp. CG50-2]WOL41197.1 class II fructose-bisphosphatase [Pyramidobacter sp. YE332]